MIKMKALRSFGVQGANEGKVRRGREFEAANEHRVKDLETRGLAYRIDAKVEAVPINKMEPAPQNKAAAAGPLGFHGGETGEDKPAPSLQAVRPRRGRPPKNSVEKESES